MRKIGIIGGMGPEATINLYERIIKIFQKKYNAKYDSDFPEMYICNLPIPDIVENIEKINTIIEMMRMASKNLEKIGMDFIAIPCNTINIIYDKYGEDGLKEKGGMPHMMDPVKLFAQMMGQMGMQRENDVPDSVNHIKLTLEQLYTGETIEEEIERHSLCDKCNGKGSDSGEDISCKKCKGQGVTMKAMAPGMFTQTQCKDCKGSCFIRIKGRFL